jgi:hypothetical protein
MTPILASISARRALRRGSGLPSPLPFRSGMLGFRKLGDVVAGVLERDELAPALQVDRIIEFA